MFPNKIIDFLNRKQIVQALPREVPRPQIEEPNSGESIDSGKHSNGRKDDSNDHLLCKDERLNSMTNSTAKNSNPFTQSSATRNPNSTPITKLCGQRVLSEAFYSQTPQQQTNAGKINPTSGTKIQNITHPFMNGFVSQDEMNSQTTLTEEAQHRY